MKPVKTGGGLPAVLYTFRKAREVGGLWKLWKAMRSKNACKTCALGMGGQMGGMVNESGHFPEVCKKSLQAMAADMQGAIKPDFFAAPTRLPNCKPSRRASWRPAAGSRRRCCSARSGLLPAHHLGRSVPSHRRPVACTGAG